MRLRCGDIYWFDTREVKNRTHKDKIHICVCIAPTHFLFINSKFHSAEDFKITKRDWAEMRNDISYISCSALLDDTYFNKDSRKDGRLSDNALSNLIDHIEKSITLTPKQKDLLVNAIASELLS
jgi:hypothetical protein